MSNYDNLNQEKQPEFGYTYVQGLGFVPYPQAHKERSRLITCANAVGLTVLLYLFLQMTVQPYVVWVFRLFFPRIRYFNAHLIAPDWLVQTVSAVCFVMCSAIAYGLYLLFIRIPLKSALPLKRPKLTIVVPAVFVCLAVSVIGTLASSSVGRVFGLFGLIPIMPEFSIPVTLNSFVLSLFNLCILPAILEEFIYRGVLMQSLRRFGDGFALTISAVIFSLMHLNFVQAPNALLMGLVIGYFVIRTGSLVTGIVIHFFNNLLALGQQMLISRLPTQMAEVISLGIVLLYLVLGLLSIVLLSRNTEHLFELKPLASVYTVRQRVRMFFSCPAIMIALVMLLSSSLRNLQFVP